MCVCGCGVTTIGVIVQMLFLYNCVLLGASILFRVTFLMGCLYYLDDNAGGNTTIGVTELLL